MFGPLLPFEFCSLKNTQDFDKYNVTTVVCTQTCGVLSWTARVACGTSGIIRVDHRKNRSNIILNEIVNLLITRICIFDYLMCAECKFQNA